MHLTCIPRHRLELTSADYAALAFDCIAPADGPATLREFERRFAEFLGSRNAIAVPSGRVGLQLLLQRFNLVPGDEAVIPAFNLHAVIEQFVRLGLTPRLCDVQSSDLNINPVAAERLITPKTRILLATHMFGHAADMNALTDLAERRNLILLEDCAHALGARYDRRRVGTFGKAAIFSFSVLKLVTTFGGGMITTDDDTLAAGIREDLNWYTRVCSRATAVKRAVVGAVLDFGTRTVPFSIAVWPALRIARLFRPDFQQRMMTELPPKPVSEHRQRRTAAVPSALHSFQTRLGLRQLARADELIHQRRRINAWLDREWKDLPMVCPLRARAESHSNGLYYGLLADRPRELAEYLFQHGVDAETAEYRNCADLEAYRPFAADCPVAQAVESRIIRLPNHPGLSHDDVRRIGRLVRRFYAAGAGVVTTQRSASRTTISPRVFARPESEKVPIAAQRSAPTTD